MWVGGGAGWHPRLDKGNLLIEANKPTSTQIATCKFWMFEEVNVIVLFVTRM